MALAQAMAQDIRYLGVRVGETCGPRTAWQGGGEGRKIYVPLPLPYHMGLSHYPSHGHGRRDLRLGNIAWVWEPLPNH